ncbi:NfeD family protein [Euzebya tangerina]|uniref:NfeD family protein n=1 Tax=Euzebya tangerina TaxID=591198 RepID=UPI000E3181BB|nr:NfeD family protein [Euzebya tangerina]
MSRFRLLGGTLLILGLLVGIAAPALAQSSASDRVDVIEAVGVLDAPLTGFVTDAVAQAGADGAQAVVIRLDTPGGLGGDVDRLVETMQASPIPVVVYVGDPGARAFGAGVQVAAAADVLALSPVTTYGVASPLDLGQPDALEPDEVTARLVDAAANTDRNEEFFRLAAAGSSVIAVPDGEAGTEVVGDAKLPDRADASAARTLDESALRDEGIADIVASTLQGVLSRLVDIEVQTADGPVTLNVDPVTANVRFVNTSLWVRILHTAASPTLAYLLLLSGAIALFFEIFQPGFGVAGFSAIGILALGVYALVPLPVSALWIMVALVGLLLLAFDLAIADLSWPTALGTLLLGLGSFRMWRVAELSPPGWLIVIGTIASFVFFGFMMTTVLRAQGNQALQGVEQVTGKIGIVRSALNPEGHVFVGGALWRARKPEGHTDKVRPGTRVRVNGLNDKLTLDVTLLEDEIDVPA